MYNEHLALQMNRESSKEWTERFDRVGGARGRAAFRGWRDGAFLGCFYLGPINSNKFQYIFQVDCSHGGIENPP